MWDWIQIREYVLAIIFQSSVYFFARFIFLRELMLYEVSGLFEETSYSPVLKLVYGQCVD